MPIDSSPAEPSSNGFRRCAVLMIAVAAGIHAAALLHSTPLQSANDRSRWSTVWSLVDRGTFVIDEIDVDSNWSTIDKVQHEGHLYSTKPALLMVLAAGIYDAIRHTLGWSLYGSPAAVTRLVLLIVNLVPWIAALTAVASMAAKYGRTNFARGYLLAAAAFATFLSTYSTTFNNHTVAAVSLIFALWFALRVIADGSRTWWDFALCGLTSAFVTTNELPAAAFGLVMFFLLLRADAKRTLLIFVPAALIPIAGFVITTWLQTGSWKPFYMSYGTSKYIFIRDGLPSYWAVPKGLDRNLDSPAVYFLHCMIGHHGIFSLSPVFLLSLVTWLRLWKRPAEPYRPLLWMGLGLTLLIVAFYLSRTENYNYGGNTVALRWAIWLIPFWLIALLPTLDDFADRRWFRAIAVALLGLSTFTAWEAIGNPWRPSWLFTAMSNAGWIDYRDHDPPLPRTLKTWFPTLPTAGADPSVEWIELTSATATGTETLRLELVESGEQEVRLRLMTFETIANHREPRETITATIDRAKFDAGDDASSFLIAAKPSKPAAIEALQRLPRAVAYRPGPVRFLSLTTPIRDVGFRTQRAIATIDVRRRTGDILRHRLDTWLCEDVPFGLVRLQQTLTEARTGEVLQRRDYELTAAGRMAMPEWAERIGRLE